MIDKLEAIKNRREEVESQLSQPDAMSDMKEFTRLNKEYRKLEPIVAAYHEYKNLLSNLENSKSIIANEKDEEFRELAKAEYEELYQKLQPMEEHIRNMLIPEDPQDERDAILEIRAGTGGDEACLFAGDLMRMYLRFCDKNNLKAEVVDTNYGSAGGYSRLTIEVSGDHAYGIMKYESGVHRVQRVPDTETQGRVHTSAATVVVLPEADDIDIELKESDVRVDTFCSSGPGGQSVNTTYSAVRLTHVPTGIVAQCQDEKSQTKNKEKAMKVLRARIYEVEYQKWLDEVSKKRKTMVSTGDRSAKVRTYNYPQGRVTDHRIGYTMYNLSGFVDGDIRDLIDQLQLAENAEKLKDGSLVEA
ncbi:MAG: peptide chain release factor 1 [Bacteroidetes bacterium]|nr:peptide chain release factor 1 [Bacteroidota bacterium]